jgi:hypothetical protein
MGVDTHLYLLDYRKYSNEVVPALHGFLHGGESAAVRPLFEQARVALDAARKRWPPLWGPLNLTDEEFLLEALLLLDGKVPDSYFGERHLEGAAIEPALVREYSIRDKVANLIVEGVCVPWDLAFPPVHNVTFMLSWELYEHSKRFEDVLCGEIHSRSRDIPFEICVGDELLDADLVAELFTEMKRISPPATKLWDDQRYRNLYLILQQADRNADFRILSVYI